MSVHADTLPLGCARRRTRERRGRLLVAIFAVLALLAMIVGIAIGPVVIGPATLVQILGVRLGLASGEPPAFAWQVIESIRMPRVLLAACAGAALGAAGAVMQGLFRNPLADPGIIGVSSGGALGAVAVIVLGTGAGITNGFTAGIGAWMLPLAAFAGALTFTWLIYRMSSHEGHVVVATMLLAGVAMNALAGAALGFLTYLSDEQQLRLLTFWTLGSVGGANWAASLPAMLVMVFATAWVLRLARPLNAVLLGEADAASLGVDLGRLKRNAILASALAVGAAVSACGILGFVGLVVPHLVRLLCGPDHRWVLPGSIGLGAALLVAADLFARLVVAPTELPLGVVTAAIGAPFFLWLLLRNRGRNMFR